MPHAHEKWALGMVTWSLHEINIASMIFNWFSAKPNILSHEFLYQLRVAVEAAANRVLLHTCVQQTNLLYVYGIRNTYFGRCSTNPINE